MQQKEQVKWYFTEVRFCCNHWVNQLKGILKNDLCPSQHYVVTPHNKAKNLIF
jgi:hypothetical protein